MLRRRALWSPGRHSRDISLESLHLGAVCLGREFHECVQRYFHPGRLLLRDLHEVREDAADDSLVAVITRQLEESNEKISEETYVMMMTFSLRSSSMMIGSKRMTTSL